MKRCADCSRELSLSSFPKHKKSPDGLEYTCSECISSYKKRYYLKNRDKIREKQKNDHMSNRDRNNLRSKSWSLKNKDRIREYRLNNLFGISTEEYETMMRCQDSVCAICLNPEIITNSRCAGIYRLAVDHCHSTGAIRGLLCSNCNKVLGLFKDSIEIFKRAIEYLEKNS